MSSTERFSTRVENYVKYRPSYPVAVVDLLRSECGLSPASTVADVGAGTGILSELLLETGATVYAIEPNAEMRGAAEQILANRKGFQSVVGTAEATSLDDESMDLVTAGQAFHWFEPTKTREEFRRILRHPKWVALIWNERIPKGNAFLEGYEEILQRFAPEYMEVRHEAFGEERLQAFFQDGQMEIARFDNDQLLDLSGLRGRFLSSSYAPEEGHPLHQPAMEALDDLFDRTQKNSSVNFLYETQIFYGVL